MVDELEQEENEINDQGQPEELRQDEEGFADLDEPAGTWRDEFQLLGSE